MQPMQIIVENNSILNRTTVDDAPNPNSNFGSHMTQVFKGIAGLCGLSTLGGLVYWVSGWFGEKSDNTANVDNTGKASVEVLGDNGSALVPNVQNNLVPINANSVGWVNEEHSSTEFNLQSKLVVTAHKQNQQAEDHIFSTDDLAYRGKAAGFEELNHQRKLLSISESSNYTYLPSVELSNIVNGWGSKLNGGGYSVSGAGDINGDGIDDLVIGVPDSDSGAGSSYVVFGKNTTWVAQISLSSLNGVNGFELNGAANDNSGYSVSVAGDINGDGIDDLVIGAPGKPSYALAGAAYVVFGKKTAWTSPFALSSLNGVNGFKLNGEAANDRGGQSVSRVGDINGDGIDDLVIGAPGAYSVAGASYVVFGKKTAWSSSIALSSLNGANGFKLIGEVTNDSSGFSVSAAGDINGDGIDDIVIGAPVASSVAGASYVLFGKKTGWASSILLSSLNGANGFKLIGALANDYSGSSVSVAGDINGDGIDDLVVGAHRVSSSAGASYVVFGKKTTWASSILLSSLNGVNGFKLIGEVANDYSGCSVSAAGDINGDGIDDIVIGAFSASSSAGASYVVFGKNTTWVAQIALSSLNGVNGFKLNGAANDNSGHSVSAAGDFNGDGVDDLVIVASQAGTSYVVFGGC